MNKIADIDERDTAVETRMKCTIGDIQFIFQEDQVPSYN